MNTLLKFIYYHFTTESFRVFVDYRRRVRWYHLYCLVNEYYKDKSLSKEQKACLSFLKSHRWNLDAHRSMYMSDIVREYEKKLGMVIIHNDEENNLPYVIHEQKRLYFKRSYNDDTIRNVYAQFLSEMDVKSPHVYCKNPEELNGRVLYDCGVAEGLFPLTHIDRLKSVYLFECDDEWLEALSATFKPYGDKVKIVKSLVSNKSDGLSISLDDFAKKNKEYPTFLKMDIEGFEELALQGAKSILQCKNLICSICTYHKPTSEEAIIQYMLDLGYKPMYNTGYMFFHCEEIIKPPYLRRGVVRFYKQP